MRTLVIKLIIFSAWLADAGLALASPPPGNEVDVHQLLTGKLQLASIDDLPTTVQLPRVLVSLASNVVAKTALEDAEMTACFRAEPSGEWTVGSTNVGGRIRGMRADNLPMDCVENATGFMHTHPFLGEDPNRSSGLPSDRDFAGFVTGGAPFTLIAHHTGICALVRGTKKAFERRLLSDMATPALFYLRHTVSALSRSRGLEVGYDSPFATGIAGAAGRYGIALYCGGPQGRLSKVFQHGVLPAIDIMLAKALLIMERTARERDMPEINFRFIPVLDPEFVAYLNRVLPLRFTTDSKPADIVTIVFEFFDAYDRTGYGVGIQLPDFRLNDVQDYLAFLCSHRASKPGMACIIDALKNPLNDLLSSESRTIAQYLEGEHDFVFHSPSLKANNYQIERTGVRGTGAWHSADLSFTGTFIDGWPDGDGIAFDKSTNKRYNVRWSDGELTAR